MPDDNDVLTPTPPRARIRHGKELLTLRLHEGADFRNLKKQDFENLMIGKIWPMIDKLKDRKVRNTPPPQENWIPARRDTAPVPVDPICEETGRYEISVCDLEGNCISFLCIQYHCDDDTRFEECRQI